MEDFYIILVVVAAVAFFVIVQWLKAFNAPDSKDKKDTPARKIQPRPTAPATSFEDILRELQPKAERAKESAKSIVREAQESVQEKVLPPLAPEQGPSARKYVNYEDNPVRELSWEKTAEAIEAAKQWRLRQKKEFNVYNSVSTTEPSRYAAMLNKPAAARDAFVLSEIFKRKYD